MKSKSSWVVVPDSVALCRHEFRPVPHLPKDKWECSLCLSIQTQLESCNGNCRCGGEQDTKKSFSYGFDLSRKKCNNSLTTNKGGVAKWVEKQKICGTQYSVVRFSQFLISCQMNHQRNNQRSSISQNKPSRNRGFIFCRKILLSPMRYPLSSASGSRRARLLALPSPLRSPLEPEGLVVYAGRKNKVVGSRVFFSL